MKALIVGGEPNFVKNVLTERLLEYDIEVFSVWDWDHSKPITKIPSECDCVIVVKDMTGHTQRNVANTSTPVYALQAALVPQLTSQSPADRIETRNYLISKTWHNVQTV